MCRKDRSHRGRTVLLDLVVEREALLEEHLAASADHEQAATRARTMAAHLRARTEGAGGP